MSPRRMRVRRASIGRLRRWSTSRAMRDGGDCGRRGRGSLPGRRHGPSQVKGFQGTAAGPHSVLACVKHFAGYGAAEGGRDYDSSYIPEELLRNVYLVPFHAAVDAGVGSLMSAYMDLNDVPASGNRWLLHDVLRTEWGFRGFVVTDAIAAGTW